MVVICALSPNWRRRLLTKDSSFWSVILVDRHEAKIVSSLHGEMIIGLWSSSSWWKWVSLVGTKEVDSPYWFVDRVIRKVGLDFQTSFWNDPWFESIPLKAKFLGLFSKSVQSNDLVREISLTFNMILTWYLRWKRSFFLRELHVFDVLLTFLRYVALPQEKDKWIWKHARDGMFLVAFTYLDQRISLISSLGSSSGREKDPPFYLDTLGSWSYHGNFCKIYSCLENIYLIEGPFLTLAGSLIPCVGTWLIWFLISLLLVN